MATVIFWIVYIVVLIGIFIGLDRFATYIYRKITELGESKFQDLFRYTFIAGALFIGIFDLIKRLVIGE